MGGTAGEGGRCACLEGCDDGLEGQVGWEGWVLRGDGSAVVAERGVVDGEAIGVD